MFLFFIPFNQFMGSVATSGHDEELDHLADVLRPAVTRLKWAVFPDNRHPGEMSPFLGDCCNAGKLHRERTGLHNHTRIGERFPCSRVRSRLTSCEGALAVHLGRYYFVRLSYTLILHVRDQTRFLSACAKKKGGS